MLYRAFSHAGAQAVVTRLLSTRRFVPSTAVERGRSSQESTGVAPGPDEADAQEHRRRVGSHACVRTFEQDPLAEGLRVVSVLRFSPRGWGQVSALCSDSFAAAGPQGRLASELSQGAGGSRQPYRARGGGPRLRDTCYLFLCGSLDDPPGLWALPPSWARLLRAPCTLPGASLLPRPFLVHGGRQAGQDGDPDVGGSQVKSFARAATLALSRPPPLTPLAGPCAAVC